MENSARKNRDKSDYVLYFFLIVWAVALLAALLEVFTYDGFISKHIGIEVKNIFVATIVLGITTLLLGKKESPAFYSHARKINRVGFFLLLLAWAIFSFLEERNYPNYVYSTFHIQINSFRNPLALSVFLFFLELFEKSRLTLSFRGLEKVNIQKKLVFSKPLIYKLLVQGLIILILVGNILKIASLFKKDIFFMVSKPLATYDEKMQEALGKEFYDFTVFVRQNTPSDVNILIPPQGYPWPQTGNKFYLRYFLYPRKLLNGREYEPGYDYKKEGIDYVLIAWGESSASQYGYTNGWPKFDVPAEEITYMDKDGSKEVKNKDYVFKEDTSKGKWGIIKVKK